MSDNKLTTYELAAQIAKTPSAALINAMMRQKDAVLNKLNAKEFFEAKELLDLFHPVWNCEGYGYKGRELYRLLRDAVRSEITAEEDFLTGERKNSRVRVSTQANIDRLIELAKEC